MSGPKKERHGHAPESGESRTYQTWGSMKRRCKATKGHDYDSYTARGITVCERWNKFSNFLADMGEAPQGMTLDRINNDGNYEPGNCRWATRKEQARNTSRNRWLTLGDKTMLADEWMTFLGIRRTSFYWRLKNWPTEKVLSTPRRKWREHERAA